ncbi:MAG: hypothetical protein M3547_13120, partial [Acidobacteriota bacterium]|nr:hypothetical protein [Acidobacteriota bacterium]
SELAWGHPATLLVRFASVKAVRMRRGTLKVEALADDGSGAVRIVWHNRYPSFRQALESGKTAAIYGTPVAGPRGEMRIENPETEFFEPGEESDPLHSGRVVPIYHRAADVPSRRWRTLVRKTLDVLGPDFAGAAASAGELLRGLEGVHFPADAAVAERSRRVLVEE